KPFRDLFFIGIHLELENWLYFTFRRFLTGKFVIHMKRLQFCLCDCSKEFDFAFLHLKHFETEYPVHTLTLEASFDSNLTPLGADLSSGFESRRKTSDLFSHRIFPFLLDLSLITDLVRCNVGARGYGRWWRPTTIVGARSRRGLLWRGNISVSLTARVRGPA